MEVTGDKSAFPRRRRSPTCQAPKAGRRCTPRHQVPLINLLELVGDTRQVSREGRLAFESMQDNALDEIGGWR